MPPQPLNHKPFRKKIAILGSGFGTRVTAPALRAEGWDIVALFSRRPDRAQKIAAKLGIPHHTDDPLALVTRDDIDAVVVSTPTATHHAIALAALNAGKHVLCEKPFAANLPQAREMVAAAAATGRTAMCDFEFRYSEHLLHITQRIQDGQIGRPQSATATLYFAQPLASWGLDWRSRLDMGGGALNEHGSHYFDALRGWMGEITSISAHLATHEPDRTDPESGLTLTADADDFLAATLTFDSGAVANVSIIWSARIPARGDLHITGPGGTISHRAPNGLFAPGPITHTPPISAQPSLLNPGPGIDEGVPLPLPTTIESLPGPEIIAASRRLLRDFERGIADGVSPSPNFHDGLRSQAIPDAARESARTGRVVPIPPA